MSRIIASALLIVASASTQLAVAEQGFDPAARAQRIAPLIDEQTVAVVHVDVSRIQVDPLIDKVVELVPEAAGRQEEPRTELKRLRQAFLAAQAPEFYLVFSLADLPQGSPVLVVPLREGVPAEPLFSIIQEGYDFHQRLGDSLVLASSEAAERLRSLEPDPRPELADAFGAAGDTAVQVLLLPPAYSRRIVEELLPTLPEAVGGGPSTILTQGLLWAAIGADGPPRTALRLVVQSQDAQAAGALRAKWLRVFDLLAAQEKARRLLGNPEEVAKLLTPRVQGSQLVLDLSEKDGSMAALLAAVKPPIEAARARAQRKQSANNLKQLALAMHNYHDVHKTFPPVGSTDAEGKPLLSWRVLILPYVEQRELYEQFHLDEPWDGPHNRQLIAKMPAVFRCPASKLTQKQGLATYRVVSGEGTVFPPGQAVPIKEIKDGTSNTIMIVEVDDQHAVIWTKPEGLPFDPDNPARGVGGQFEGGFDAALCDGSVRFISEAVDPKILRLLLLRADGKAIPPGSEW